jgi:tRNA 2-thiouridine synthesizing protein D
MKFSINVLGAPYSSQASLSALRFADAVRSTGHEVYRVFFYHDGVYNGNSLMTAPQDELDPNARWAKFALQHQVELVVCIASSLRRGMLDKAEADRYEKHSHSLSSEFTVSGLGQLIDASLQSDRTVIFSS